MALVQRLGVAREKLAVVPGAVDAARFHPVDAEPARRRYELPGRYLLFVGSLQPRKNLSGLMAAMERLNRRFPDLALAVCGAGDAAFRGEALSQGNPRVRWLSYVPEEDLPGLYSGAEACVLPSWYEGFGLPLLEAMACGCPAAAACAGALPEVVGEAGVLFDPASPDDIAQKLAGLLTDAELREELHRRGLERAGQFSWQRSAALVEDVLQGLA
jgi:glycosyltransferase involved in cell wall biosynthesis